RSSHSLMLPVATAVPVARNAIRLPENPLAAAVGPLLVPADQWRISDASALPLPLVSTYTRRPLFQSAPPSHEAPVVLAHTAALRNVRAASVRAAVMSEKNPAAALCTRLSRRKSLNDGRPADIRIAAMAIVISS